MPNTSTFFHNIPSTEDFRIVADLFKMIDDETRLRLFWILCHTEECVINLASSLSMSSPAIIHHLKKLKSCGLITSRKEGKEVYYRSSDSTEAKALHTMIETMMMLSCPRDVSTEEGLNVSQAELIREIHDFLVSDLTKRYTIEFLSKKFLINTSTLKEVFKAVYGKPIATYMKEFRMETAKASLQYTDKHVSTISHEIGYESQSKFTEGFRKYTGLLPTEYRKLMQEKV